MQYYCCYFDKSPDGIEGVLYLFREKSTTDCPPKIAIQIPDKIYKTGSGSPKIEADIKIADAKIADFNFLDLSHINISIDIKRSVG